MLDRAQNIQRQAEDLDFPDLTKEERWERIGAFFITCKELLDKDQLRPVQPVPELTRELLERDDFNRSTMSTYPYGAEEHWQNLYKAGKGKGLDISIQYEEDLNLYWIQTNSSTTPSTMR